MADLGTEVQALKTHLATVLSGDNVVRVPQDPREEWTTIYQDYWPSDAKRSLFIYPMAGKFTDETGNVSVINPQTILAFAVKSAADDVLTLGDDIDTFFTEIYNALESYNGFMIKNRVDPFPQLKTPLGGQIITVTLQACGG